MRLPYLLNPFYRVARRTTPERVKPYVRGWYNKINKFATYGRTDIFAALDIETNSRCNLHCSYCPVSMYDRGDHFMPEETFKKVIDDVAAFPFEYKGRISPHFYGDPLIDERLPDLLRYARERLPKSVIIIHSNGIKLTREAYRKLVDAGVTGFLITRHMKFFPKTVRDILEFEPDAKKYMTLQRLDNVGIFERGGTNPVHNAHQFKRCHYVADEIAVDYHGNVICTNDFFCRDVFGNVNDRSLAEIWWDPQFTRRRMRLASGIFDSQICRDCSAASGMTYDAVPEDSMAVGYQRRITPEQIRQAIEVKSVIK